MKLFQSKMPVSRQIRYYKQSRDHWKENAAEKQKKLRSYLQLTRALKKSRATWKTKAKEAEARAKQAEKKNKELEHKLQQFDPSFNSDSDESSSSHSEANSLETDDDDCENLPAHHYPISTIFKVVQQFINVGNSYRGIAKTMKVFSDLIPQQTPHFTTIKQWVERLGLYQLQRPKPQRNDWLYLADFTLELGPQQAFVIYGISLQQWLTHILPQHRALQHTDGDILALELTDSPTADWIYSVLDTISQNLGIPRQIVSDHASNLKQGIQLFQAHHPQLIYTYDVSHALANLLKKELLYPEIFHLFLQDCHHCRQQVLQTDLYFAAPPPQRSLCRFFNLEPLTHWAIHFLRCPFSLFRRLLPHYSPDYLSGRLQDKFSWLFSYQDYLPFWMLQMKLIRLLQRQLKIFGLHSSSLTQFNQLLSRLYIPPSLNPFQEHIFQYLTHEISLLSHQTLLASSDVLESIFGRYKEFSKRCPLKELRTLLLTIPLSTINLTHQFIKDALSTVHASDLARWVNQTFGQSMLSKRKILFSF